jgi:hypothetical protein
MSGSKIHDVVIDGIDAALRRARVSIDRQPQRKNAIGDPTTASVPTSPASPVFDTTTAATPNPDDLAADILHGAQAIADYIGVDLRRAFYLLQHGYIPAVKTGATWTSTKSRLRRHFNGEQ